MEHRYLDSLNTSGNDDSVWDRKMEGVEGNGCRRYGKVERGGGMQNRRCTNSSLLIWASGSIRKNMYQKQRWIGGEEEGRNGGDEEGWGDGGIWKTDKRKIVE